MTKSQQWGERLMKVIAGGSSTRSKSPRYMPDEPGVIVRGKGCRVWDADGREYIDYRSALGPVTLGYRYPAVDEAIRKQLNSGIVFGHPHPLEGEVAEMVCDIIPCAERARFLKTGGGKQSQLVSNSPVTTPDVTTLYRLATTVGLTVWHVEDV